MRPAQPTYTATTPTDGDGNTRIVGYGWRWPHGFVELKLHAEPYEGMIVLEPIRRAWWQRWRA